MWETGCWGSRARRWGYVCKSVPPTPSDRTSCILVVSIFSQNWEERKSGGPSHQSLLPLPAPVRHGVGAWAGTPVPPGGGLRLLTPASTMGDTLGGGDTGCCLYAPPGRSTLGHRRTQPDLRKTGLRQLSGAFLPGVFE